jgi:hypothetical protein
MFIPVTKRRASIASDSANDTALTSDDQLIVCNNLVLDTVESTPQNVNTAACSSLLGLFIVDQATDVLLLLCHCRGKEAT